MYLSNLNPARRWVMALPPEWAYRPRLIRAMETVQWFATGRSFPISRYYKSLG